MAKIDAPKPLPCRVAFLRSFTVEPVFPLLKASALLHGLDVSTWVGGFNAYAQEMLTPGSGLFQFNPHVAILAVQTRDLLPAIWNRFTELPAAEIDAIIAQAVADLRSIIVSFRQYSSAHLIIHDAETPMLLAQGVLDSQGGSGQAAAIAKFNTNLRALAAETAGVYTLGYDALVAAYGRARWHDERKWLTMRMPIAADALHCLSQEYVRFLAPLMGRVCKVLVVDMDNTLWGGVVGEDGVHGIKIGSEYPGAAFLSLHRAILDLYHRGILIAACSKNNMADAMEVFAARTEMLLKPAHFAAMRVNWEDKAQNLREIAAELNVGIDSLAFLDDNPIERQRVQSELPEVTVLEVTADPMQYAAILRAAPEFERLSLSAEDRERGSYYVQQRERREMQESAGTLDDFLAALDMEAVFEPVSEANLQRIAQLTQKTNQFNVTTRRYSEQQITDMASDSTWDVFGMRLSDRYGDNGLVGVAIVHHLPDACEIDTLLMSCRVIGRTAETAMLAHIADAAIKRGAGRIRGLFIPTKKNEPAKELFKSHGFELIAEGSEGLTWELDITASPVQWPEHIAVKSAVV